MIDKIQEMYISLFSPFIRYSNRINEKIRYRALTGCFILNIIMFCIVQLVLRKENYFYNSFFGILLMFVIIFLSLDQPLQKMEWRPFIFTIWMLFCISLTISDLIVPKQTCGLGIILGFLFSGVFFVWQNNRRKDLLWKCFKDALKITFLLMSVISFLVRPYFKGGRYAGIFTNPNTFGLYLFVIFCVYISDMDWLVETNRPVKKQIWCYLQMALVLFYISVSQARTSMIAIVSIFTVWIVCRIIIDRKRRCHLPFIKSLLLMVAITVVMYPVFFWALNTIPDVVGHPVIYKGDTLYLQSGAKIEDVGEKLLKEEQEQQKQREEAKKKGIEVPKTSGNKMSENNVFVRFVDQIASSFTGGNETGDGLATLNRLSNGRITIYQAYIEDLNLFGHRQISKHINNHVVAHAHNNWLQYGYTYGLLAMFAYFILTIASLIYGVRFFFKGHKKYASYCFLPCAIIVGFLAASLTECLFQPFEIYPAFAFWFAFGDIFLVSQNKEIQK